MVDATGEAQKPLLGVAIDCPLERIERRPRSGCGAGR